MKKLTALFLAVVMMMALATSASAAGTGIIKITGATTGTTYNIYKVLDVENTEDAYRYKEVSGWGDFVNAQTTYVTVTDGYVVWKDYGVDATAFVAAAYSYATTENISATDSQVAAGSSVTFENLDPGYYIVKSSRGDSIGAGTTINGGTVEIAEKNTSLPYITKGVREDDGDTWGESNIAAIGETVNFEIVVAAGTGGKDYVIEDTLGAGFTFDENTVAVTYEGNVLTKDTDYTVGKSGQVVTFDLTLYCEKNALVANDEFRITYTAKLNTKAVIAGTGNKNDAKLAYDEVNLGTTAKTDSTTTYTSKIDVKKYVTGGTTPLENVGFTLYSDAGCTSEVAGESFTDAQGKLTFAGLDTGTYYLKETTVLPGYTGAEVKTISITAKNPGVTEGSETVYNTPGQELPETGGMGTTALYAVGAVLMLGAVAVLAGKKKVFEK